MVDQSLMYSEDYFVLLVPGQEEVILSTSELQNCLEEILASHQTSLPVDLQKIPTISEQARHLMDTACDFEVDLGKSIQWFAVRLNK
jgi:hypothetical protein